MNLLASSLLGGLYLMILFGLCFALVTGVRCARLYDKMRRSRAAESKEEKDEKAAQPAKSAAEKSSQEKAGKKKEQRVYYIVEKKRASRPRPKYSEPKKIRFE